MICFIYGSGWRGASADQVSCIFKKHKVISNHLFSDFLAATGARGGMAIGGSPVVLVSNLNEEVGTFWTIILLEL